MESKCVVKIGGSVFDLLYYKRNKSVVGDIAKKLVTLHSEYSFVVTVGGGPFMDVVKVYDVDEQYKDLMATNALKNNCLYLEFILDGLGETVHPEDFDKISDCYLKKKIPLMYHAPEGIPLFDSDTHALAVAEVLEVGRIYFLKNTPGIFQRDPNGNSEEPNDFIQRATIDDFLSGKISRVGVDGDDEHLIENSALEFYRSARHINEIRVLDANNSENIEYALKNVSVGSVILKE